MCMLILADLSCQYKSSNVLMLAFMSPISESITKPSCGYCARCLGAKECHVYHLAVRLSRLVECDCECDCASEQKPCSLMSMLLHHDDRAIVTEQYQSSIILFWLLTSSQQQTWNAWTTCPLALKDLIMLLYHLQMARRLKL